VKLRSAVLIIALVIIADQALKIWIKTSYPVGEVTKFFGLDGAQLYFIENKGMAWGWEWGGEWGKMLLTLFRLAAVIFGTWYLVRIVKQGYSKGFIICAALIYAGALGNLIDSMFYGMIFDRGMMTDPLTHMTYNYPGIARFTTSHGYASFLHGNVVDMLYFPMIHSKFPGWLPFVGGTEFTFFSPIFNIADASISVGVITLLLFQKRFVKRHHEPVVPQTVTTSSELSDRAQVM
jgi:signal peptidase II